MPVVQIEAPDSRQAIEWFAAYHLSRGVGFLDCLVAAAGHRLRCPLHTLNVRHYRFFPGLRASRPY